MSRERIYCGNNLYEVGNRRIGTPYECLKKGVSQGLRSNLTGFNPNYQAIIPDNTYCGTKAPPMGKQLGTPMSCLRKGFGIGKKLQYERANAGDDRDDGENGDNGDDGEDGEDGENGDGEDGENGEPPLIPRDGTRSSCWAFLMKWWPVILALLVGVVAAIFRATYTTILLSMITVLMVSWFVQSVMV